MLTYRGKPIPRWFIAATLMLQFTLFLILTWID
jgi:hypothetical protein